MTVAGGKSLLDEVGYVRAISMSVAFVTALWMYATVCYAMADNPQDKQLAGNLAESLIPIHPEKTLMLLRAVDVKVKQTPSDLFRGILRFSHVLYDQFQEGVVDLIDISDEIYIRFNKTLEPLVSYHIVDTQDEIGIKQTTFWSESAPEILPLKWNVAVLEDGDDPFPHTKDLVTSVPLTHDCLDRGGRAKVSFLDNGIAVICERTGVVGKYVEWKKIVDYQKVNPPWRG